MSDTRYEQQRSEGADQIIKAAEKLSTEVGIKIERSEWDTGKPISEKTNHSLSITAKGKTITSQFPDEWLADYPGGVGTEKAKAVLSEMIRKLK
jgi:hypothetical protein